MLGAFTIIDNFLETETQTLTFEIVREINYTIKNDKNRAKTNKKLMHILNALKIMNEMEKEGNYE